MIKNKIENSLKRAVYEAPAADFGELSGKPFAKLAADDGITRQAERQVFSPLKKQLVLALSFCLVAALIFSNWFMQGKAAASSIIMLDVNPSIKIVTNDENEVISVVALNDDAEAILKDVNVKSKDLNTVMDEIISALAAHNYLNPDKRTILLSVNNEDTKKADDLVNTLNDQINSSFAGLGFEPNLIKQVITDEDSTSELAKQYNISEGKAALIEKIIAKDQSFTADQLASLTMEQLYEKAKAGNIDLQAITSFSTDSVSSATVNSGSSSSEGTGSAAADGTGNSTQTGSQSVPNDSRSNKIIIKQKEDGQKEARDSKGSKIKEDNASVKSDDSEEQGEDSDEQGDDVDEQNEDNDEKSEENDSHNYDIKSKDNEDDSSQNKYSYVNKSTDTDNEDGDNEDSDEQGDDGSDSEDSHNKSSYQTIDRIYNKEDSEDDSQGSRYSFNEDQGGYRQHGDENGEGNSDD